MMGGLRPMMMLRQPLVKTDSWLCCSQGRFATGRIFDVLGKVHDLGPSGAQISDPWTWNPSSGTLRDYGPACTSIAFWTSGKECAPSLIIACTDAQLGTTVMGISAVLFHTAWTGAYESFDTNPLIGAGLAHQFSDPQIGRSVVEATLGTAELPVIRAFSGAYQWLNLAGFTINAELFESHFRFEGLAISCFCFSGSRFHSRSAEVPIQLRLEQSSAKAKQAPFGITGLFKVRATATTSAIASAGLLSAFWAAHIGFVSIPASCSQDPRPHLGENVLAFISKPVAGHRPRAELQYGKTHPALVDLSVPCAAWRSLVLTYNAGIDGLTQAFTFSDLGHHHLAIGSFLLLAGEAQRFLELLGLLQRAQHQPQAPFGKGTGRIMGVCPVLMPS